MMDEAYLNGGFARAEHFKAERLFTSLEGEDALARPRHKRIPI
jgi:hypothetical protein